MGNDTLRRLRSEGRRPCSATVVRSADFSLGISTSQTACIIEMHDPTGILNDTSDVLQHNVDMNLGSRKPIHARVLDSVRRRGRVPVPIM